ncbi:MAG: hypothetical protein R3C10_20875 [Pirellulales bacterium]
MSWKSSVAATYFHVHRRLASELGEGPHLAALAIALCHACHPAETFGDEDAHDGLLLLLNQFTPRPCSEVAARRHVAAWLRNPLLTADVLFLAVWNLRVGEFVHELREQLGVT